MTKKAIRLVTIFYRPHCNHKKQGERIKMSKKRMLVENPKFIQYIEQDFPVVEKDFGDWKSKKVQVIGYCNSKETFECYLFKVEVVKDYDGFISFIVKGEGTSLKDLDSKRDVWIMRTDDFNQAYDLKNKLDTLLRDYIPNEKQKMHCYGSLQREKTMWE